MSGSQARQQSYGPQYQYGGQGQVQTPALPSIQQRLGQIQNWTQQLNGIADRACGEDMNRQQQPGGQNVQHGAQNGLLSNIEEQLAMIENSLQSAATRLLHLA